MSKSFHLTFYMRSVGANVLKFKINWFGKIALDIKRGSWNFIAKRKKKLSFALITQVH